MDTEARHGEEASLILKQILIRNDQKILIDRLDMEIKPGQIVSLMGPSGAGKSTLLAMIAGFLSNHFISQGEILIDGGHIENLPAEKRRIGLLFQDDLLFPHLTVAQNLAFGIRAACKRSRRESLIRNALEVAGLEGFEKRHPETLSGGQRARIALMRTLLSQPRGLLLDEPFSKLDRELRQYFRRFVETEARSRNLPTLMVTHDLEDAEAMQGPVLELGMDGKISISQDFSLG